MIETADVDTPHSANFDVFNPRNRFIEHSQLFKENLFAL
jgi:hypothetical protein